MSESLNWIKSTYSAQGNCVELTDQDQGVLVRDSQQAGTGPVLSFSADAWRAFTGQLRAR
jgi:Domain of unknown function (DUF397)